MHEKLALWVWPLKVKCGKWPENWYVWSSGWWISDWKVTFDENLWTLTKVFCKKLTSWVKSDVVYPKGLGCVSIRLLLVRYIRSCIWGVFGPGDLNLWPWWHKMYLHAHKKFHKDLFSRTSYGLILQLSTHAETHRQTQKTPPSGWSN